MMSISRIAGLGLALGLLAGSVWTSGCSDNSSPSPSSSKGGAGGSTARGGAAGSTTNGTGGSAGSAGSGGKASTGGTTTSSSVTPTGGTAGQGSGGQSSGGKGGSAIDGGTAIDANGAVDAKTDSSPDGAATSMCPSPPNVLSPTPPMGWNSWNKFACNVSETLIKSIADAMVTSGMKDAGYEYVNVDDCWQTSRTADGTIVADPQRFAGGMKALADYVHSKGLKFGLYSDRGTMTCQKRPGAQGYERKDAEAYASWGVDYLKHDNCNVSLDMQTQYRLMRTELDRATVGKRPIVLSICAWKFEPWMPEVGQLWRTTDDIEDRWSGGSRGMLTLLDQNSVLDKYASPGHWNDPDMLEVGNGGMTDTEYRSHFSLWAMMAAPLIAGNDIRNMSEATKTILLNKDVIAVDQDTLGIQGKPIRTDGNTSVWSKKLCGNQTYAVALFNRGGGPADITVTWAELGLTSASANVRDLWSHTDLGPTATQYKATAVPSHGVVMLKVAGI